MRKPFYMKKVQAWYVWYQGKQVRLHGNRAKAFMIYHELIAGNTPADPSDTVASLCNVYLD